jgi:hypothetical protein
MGRFVRLRPNPYESMRRSAFLRLSKPTAYIICDFGGRVAQSRSSRTRLTQTAINTTIGTPASLFYEGTVFDQFRTVLRGRHLSNPRVRPLVVVDYEPWSPAAWFIGGVSHFATEVPVDCTYLGYPWHNRELGACTTLWSVFRCRI